MTTTSRTLGARWHVAPVVWAVALLFGVAATDAPLRAQQAGQEVVESTISVSSGAASLEFEMEDGSTHRIEFRDGRVRFDGEVLGGYTPGGGLVRSWRDLLATAMSETPALEMTAERLRGWEPSAEGASASTAEALTDRLDRVLRAEPAAGTGDTVAMQGPGGEAVSLAPGRLSFDRLTSQLRRLQGSLERLDAEARAAGKDLALVVHDDYQLPAPRTVDGNLALLGGELRLGGTVRGDVLVLDGTLLLEPTGRVEGDVLQVGGDVRREGGTVTGELLSVRALSRDDGAAEAPEPDVPVSADEIEERIERRVEERVRKLEERHGPGFFDRLGSNVGRAVGGVFGWIGVYLMLALSGILGVYFVRDRLEVVADTARHSFGRSFGVGLAGGFLFFPVLLILVVAVITWLVIPFYVVAAAVAGLGGLIAVAHAAGEMLARRRFQSEWIERLRRSNSYYYVLSGLAALLLPFALGEALHLFGSWMAPLRGLVHFVAATLLSVAAVSGLGAVLLSRGGQRAEYARPAPGPAAAKREGGIR